MNVRRTIELQIGVLSDDAFFRAVENIADMEMSMMKISRNTYDELMYYYSTHDDDSLSYESKQLLLKYIGIFKRARFSKMGASDVGY